MLRENILVSSCVVVFYILRIKLHRKLVLSLCFPLGFELYIRQGCYSFENASFYPCLNKEDVYIKEKMVWSGQKTGLRGVPIEAKCLFPGLWG